MKTFSSQLMFKYVVKLTHYVSLCFCLKFLSLLIYYLLIQQNVAQITVKWSRKQTNVRLSFSVNVTDKRATNDNIYTALTLSVDSDSISSALYR